MIALGFSSACVQKEQVTGALALMRAEGTESSWSKKMLDQLSVLSVLTSLSLVALRK